jgi:hypothetical protein
MNSSSEPASSACGRPPCARRVASSRFALASVLTRTIRRGLNRFDAACRARGTARCRAAERRWRWHVGDELADEDHAATHLAADLAAYVEAQVHFLERAVPRDRDAEHARIAKEETDDAHVQRSATAIHFDARGYERGEQGRRNLVVQHHEVAPLGSEERSFAARLVNLVVSIAVQRVPYSNEARRRRGRDDRNLLSVNRLLDCGLTARDFPKWYGRHRSPAARNRPRCT